LLCSQEALTVPKAPDLSLKNVGEHSISLNILDNVDNEEFFILERSLNESNGFEEVVILNGGTTSYLDHGLNDDTFYYYRIKSRNKSGDSPYSKTIKIRTKKDGLTLEKTIVINVRRFIDGTVPKNREYVDFTVPGDKIGFGKSFQSETLTKLNGEKVEIGLALSNFNYGNTNGGGSLDNSIHPDDVCKTNLITNKNVVGVIKFLNLNDDKYYSIHLFSRRGWNSSKIPVRFINKELDITLNAGNNLENEAEIYTLKPDQDGTITITIQNGAEGDLGYLNAIRVEVFSENDDAIKDDNNTGSLVPASPTELKLQSLRPDSVMLSWKDKSDNESHFEIQISKDETFSSEILNFETGINDSTILINGLEEYSIYYARARAKNHHGYSNLSNTIFFKTLLLTKKLNLKIYPNPADNHVNIEYNIMADEQVEIQLIDLITGQQIKTLLNAFQVKNKYKIKWELGDININRIKNLFLIKIITSQVSEYKKLMIIKNKFNF
ncbi:MAG: fibronectin type III domain-containing protein, partial [Cyclobacteriaceae bacterium]